MAPTLPRHAARAVSATTLAVIAVLWADTLWWSAGTWTPAGFVAAAVPAVLGAWLCWRRPFSVLAWLVLACGGMLTLSVWGPVWARAHAGEPAAPVLTAVTAGLYFPALFVPVTLILLRYPTGVPSGRWRHLLDRVIVFGMLLVGVAFAVSAGTVEDELRGQQQPFAVPEPVALAIAAPGLVLVLAGAVVVVLDAVLRAVRARGADRVALWWLLTTAVVFAVTSLLLDGIWAFEVLPAPAMWGALGYGVVRHRVLDIDVVVRRGLLFLVLTGLVLVLLVAATAVSVRVLPRDTATLVAAVVVVGVLLPARDWIQSLLDRLLYGTRTDPWSTMRGLASAPPEAGPQRDRLGTVTTGLAGSLRVPAARLVDRDGVVVAEAGHPDLAGLGDPTRVPLVLASVPAGYLVVSPRPGERRLGAADLGFLEALAPLLAAILEADRLGEEVRRERNRVLEASAAERRRLRQELHDGLGPSLTGIGLGLEALAQQPGPDTDRRQELVERLRTEAAAALVETRRVIEDLGPGVLEGLDLVSALRRRGEQVAAVSGLEVVVHGTDPWPPVPASVASALYRVADEALVNVVRHAHARRCVVRLTAGQALCLSVVDDGVGPDGEVAEQATSRCGGVGLVSMRERVERLGGTFVLGNARPGTQIVVELPW